MEYIQLAIAWAIENPAVSGPVVLAVIALATWGAKKTSWTWDDSLVAAGAKKLREFLRLPAKSE